MSSNARQLGELATAGIGKNVIINGNFNIWQRGTNFASVATSTAVVDRWKWFQGGSGVVDIDRSTDVPDNESGYSFGIGVTTADASIAAGDNYEPLYVIEGYDMQRFGWGTSDAKPATISFWVKSNTPGTYSIGVRNASTDRSMVLEYTINSSAVWEYKSITFPGETSGTWDKATGVGAYITFGLAGGSTFQTSTIGSWISGSSLFYSTNQTNFMATNGNYIRWSRFQMEVGNVATEFERRHIQHEEDLCHRYYYAVPDQQGEGSSNAGCASGVFGSGNSPRVTVTLPVRMRVDPTVSFANLRAFDGGSAYTVSSISGSWMAKRNCMIVFSASGGSVTRGAVIYRDNNQNGGIFFDAEF